MKPKALDIAACVFVALLAIVSALPFIFSDDGGSLYVTADGKEYSISLVEDGEHIINSNGESLTLAVHDGKAHVSAHTCPDGLCQRMGSIKRSGESIVCLPAKVSVTVIGSESEVGQIDGIAG